MLQKNLKQSHLILILTSLCLLVSLISSLLNTFVFHYTGIKYYPVGALQTCFTVILLYFATYNRFGKHNKITQMAKLLLIFFAILAVVAIITTAAQYTPFPLIEEAILKAEPFDLIAIIVWAKQHPSIYNILFFVYNSLNFEIAVLPLLLIMSLKKEYLYEYFILILYTAIIGFGFYYFYPSNGPATLLNPDYFENYQIAVSVRFDEIHKHLPPSSLEGGLVACPSFHVIWAWLTVYAIRPFRKLYYVLLPYNMLIAIACIMLGWHYVIDIFASVVILGIAHGLCVMHGTTAKRCKARRENHPCIQ